MPALQSIIVAAARLCSPLALLSHRFPCAGRCYASCCISMCPLLRFPRSRVVQCKACIIILFVAGVDYTRCSRPEIAVVRYETMVPYTSGEFLTKIKFFPPFTQSPILGKSQYKVSEHRTPSFNTHLVSTDVLIMGESTDPEAINVA